MFSNNRRNLLKAGAATIAASYAPSILAKNDTIKIASIYDLSGVLDSYGTPMARMVTMAVDEINESGGLLGRKVELVEFDTQSNNQLYGQYAIEAATRHKASAVFGAVTSASREVMRPLLSRHRTLYFYSTQYEGGVCDRNTFMLGTTPGQKAVKIVPYAMEKFGKRVYAVAADYNLGHIITKWHKQVVEEHGGSLVGVEFFPLEQTDFGPSIQKIQAMNPDFVMADLVGSNHNGFYRQWAAAGLNDRIGLASTIFGTGNEQIFTNPREHNGILTSACYFPAIDTPENRAFLERAERYMPSKTAPMNELPAMSYYAVMLWAKAVKEAGSAERMAVTEALESGLSYDGPAGSVTVHGPSHHVSHDIYIAETKDQQFEVRETHQNLPPSDTAAVCDLFKNPNENRQFTPV
ncbi:ABC transporter substrate-binding protein [Pusillimonas sp.]|uniref:ABC transporter substrate-binding protein n=1 Tax=Pusillimonas sp. TaxID=3040095 RepID=UPI0037C6C980